MPLNEWHHVALTYDGTRYAEGVKLYVDGEEWKWQVLLDDCNNQRPLRREPLRIGGGGGPENRFQGRIDDVRIYDRGVERARKCGVLASAARVDEIAARRTTEPERRPRPTRSATISSSTRCRRASSSSGARAARRRATKRDAYYDSAAHRDGDGGDGPRRVRRTC